MKKSDKITPRSLLKGFLIVASNNAFFAMIILYGWKTITDYTKENLICIIIVSFLWLLSFSMLFGCISDKIEQNRINNNKKNE